MAQLSFGIKGWAAWTPAGGELGFSSGAKMPSVLRRRVGTLGQAALRAAWNLPGAEKSRLVFSSRHGEFARTTKIMESLVRNEGVSPADFSLSVHHALAGLLSIATANGRGHSAVAACGDSFCNAFLEVAAGLAETPSEDVTLVYYDEPLPDPFSGFGAPDDEHLALAVLLSATEGEAVRMVTQARPAGAVPTDRPAESFLAFLRDDLSSCVAIGERMLWRWDKADVPH